MDAPRAARPFCRGGGKIKRRCPRRRRIRWHRLTVYCDALQKIKFHVLTKIQGHGRIKFAYFGDVGSVRLFLDTPGTTAPLR